MRNGVVLTLAQQNGTVDIVLANALVNLRQNRDRQVLALWRATGKHVTAIHRELSEQKLLWPFSFDLIPFN